MSFQTSAVAVAHGVESTVEAICKVVLCIAGFGLLGVLVVNVVVRYGLHGSVGALSEFPALLFPWFVMGGVVTASVRGSHVAMQLMLHSLAPVGRRWLAMFIHALSAVTFMMLAWYAVENTIIAHDEASTILRVPGSVGYSALVLTFLLIGISSLTALVRIGIGHEGVIVDLAADNGGIT
ncbi:MAG: TRAP transporter small permease subunit [Comamonadaceae bacterium]|nr:MAG: TRAP transporter small permease subunit [Comamonadaceae bacterium]